MSVIDTLDKWVMDIWHHFFIDDLEYTFQHHTAQADKKLSKVNRMLVQVSEHDNEAANAAIIKDNLSSLINHLINHQLPPDADLTPAPAPTTSTAGQGVVGSHTVDVTPPTQSSV